MDQFSACHAITAKWEGGWSNHPKDPGGATMYGVTQAKFTECLKKWGKPSRSVKTITRDEALRIYREEYWEPVGAPKLFNGVDLAAYDGAVNSGVSRSKKWLAATAKITSPVERIKAMCRLRLSFMQSLKIWVTFGRGWGNRMADIEVKAVAMAYARLGVAQKVVAQQAHQEADKAQVAVVKAAKTEKATAAGAAGSGAGAVSQSPASIDASQIDWALLAVLGGVAVAFIVVLIVINARKRANVARRSAYAELAAGAGQ